MSKRKQYSKQFKKDAINLIIKEGYKISEAARNLEIQHSTLRRWTKEIEAEGNNAFPGQGKMTPEN